MDWCLVWESLLLLVSFLFIYTLYLALSLPVHLYRSLFSFSFFSPPSCHFSFVLEVVDGL